MVLRVWTMVEANVRSSSRSKMSAIEWKMLSMCSRRQSLLDLWQDPRLLGLWGAKGATHSRAGSMAPGHSRVPQAVFIPPPQARM